MFGFIRYRAQLNIRALSATQAKACGYVNVDMFYWLHGLKPAATVCIFINADQIKPAATGTPS
ncbi:MAG: hypothetical protein A2X78_04645 [Gammaproteobacteria bacterium GWE2_37_16]|nr:MAG: hypothetical protein A2X78_04645 [Gammaproteobacteria bacterium GWE2_37_16]